MVKRERGASGKFVPKSNGFRQVRSMRLTDATWEALGNAAESRCITRADLIEEMVAKGLISQDQDASSFPNLKSLLVKVESVVQELLKDEELTRGARDRGPIRRAYKALIERLSSM